ncbi:MAG: sodium:solute symporter family protein [Bacteroidota bacterium]|nr:sodium:solute symporter family protein [Bacteroidota bacterium]
MLNNFDWLIIALYIIFIVFIGLLFRKQAGKSLSDFFLGGRKLPWWLAGLSMVATTFAADTPLVVTELVGKNGIAGNWLWWNFLIGGMLTTFFFARLWRRANVLTELEFISIRYSGKEAVALRGIRAGYIALIMNTLIIAWVNLALMTIIEVFFGISGNTLLWIMFAAMALAALYSTASGLTGIAVTDAVQFFIALVGAIILAVFVISSDQIGGIEGLKENIPSQAFNFMPNIGGEKTAGVLSISVGAFLAFGLIQWWASWYPGAEPGGGGYIAQRMMSTKNEKHSIFATLFFQIMHYAIRPWPWIIVGLAALVLYPNLPEDELRYGYVYAMRDFLPNGIKGLMLVGFLAAYMSTISTQLNFGSSLLTNDLFRLFKRNKNASQKKLVWWGRFFTLAIMVVALGITSVIKTISGVWEFMIECGAGFGLVLILRWYWWRINAWSELTALLSPFFFYAISKFILHIEFPDSFFITVGGTTISWLIVTFLTKPTNINVLHSFYQKVKPQGFWKPFDATKTTNKNIIYLLGAWISSIALIYSVLFAIGKLILKEWNSFFQLSGIIIVSLVILLAFIKKAKVFYD